MTALEMLKQIARVLGLDLPQTLTNANDMNTQRVLGLLNRALDAALNAYAWQALQKQVIFRADTQSDAYNEATGGLKLQSLAPDFGLAVTPQIYEVGSSTPVCYVSPDQYTRLLVLGVGAAEKYFSVMGGELLFLPKLTQGSWKGILRYRGKYGALGEDGTSKRYFDKDDDTSLLDEELLVLGAVYKFKQEMGYDYADAQADYEECLRRLKARDGYAPVLYGADPDMPPVRVNIPDTGAGGVK